MSNEIEVNCPTCQKRVVWDKEHPYRPFCSQRCKLIDLGEWASESNRIAGMPVLDEFSEEFETILQQLGDDSASTKNYH